MRDGRTLVMPDSIWMLALSPTIWALHFMLCYVTAAIWCAKHPESAAGFDTIRLTIGIYTGVAVAAIGFVGWLGWRAHRLGGGHTPHAADSPLDRHRFLGFATFLLSALSAVAVVFAGLVAVFVENCE